MLYKLGLMNKPEDKKKTHQQLSQTSLLWLAVGVPTIQINIWVYNFF